MKANKGDRYVCVTTGKKATITHFCSLSIGWCEDGQKNTTHTSHGYFLELYRKFVPKANNQINIRVKRAVTAIGGIGTFGKIMSAIESKSRVVPSIDKFRKSLAYLVDVGELHYFERSDTYMIKDGAK